MRKIQINEQSDMLLNNQLKKSQKPLKSMAIKQFFWNLKKYQKQHFKSEPKVQKWGDELQGHLLETNEKSQLRFGQYPDISLFSHCDFQCSRQHGKWMIQLVPKSPYYFGQDLKRVIVNFRQRYEEMNKINETTLYFTIPIIPFLGIIDIQSHQEMEKNNIATQGRYVSDHVITCNYRRTFTKVMRERRKDKLTINVPIFKDIYTNSQQLESTEPDPNFIYLDAPIFGISSACLQNTLSTFDFDHARYLYDSLNIISPLMLALTAGTPFHKGKVGDWDVRWKLLTQLFDDRSPEERDINNDEYVSTSRWCPSQVFIGPAPFNKPQYFDNNLRLSKENRKEIKQIIKQIGAQTDSFLQNYIAYLIQRQLIYAPRKLLEQTEKDYSCFNQINLKIWNSTRLKYTLYQNKILWMVELRTMEVQHMPDQNAAFSIFTSMLGKTLSQKKLNFYLPMSYVLQNFQRAYKRNALRNEKFYFRTNIHDNGEPYIRQMTIDEIFFGNEYFQGLCNQIKKTLLDNKQVDQDYGIMDKVIKFLKKRTSGKKLTLAQWMRSYIDKNPLYTHNSILSKQLIDEMLLTLSKIQRGELYDPNFKTIF